VENEPPIPFHTHNLSYNCYVTIEILVYRGTKKRTQDPNKSGSVQMPEINLLWHQKTTSTSPPDCLEYLWLGVNML